MHDHIFIHHDDMLKIYELRRTQGNTNMRKWSDIFKFADTALHGYLKYTQNSRSDIPELGYIIEIDDDCITLDGNGYSATGIYVREKSGYIIENFVEISPVTRGFSRQKNNLI